MDLNPRYTFGVPGGSSRLPAGTDRRAFRIFGTTGAPDGAIRQPLTPPPATPTGPRHAVPRTGAGTPMTPPAPPMFDMGAALSTATLAAARQQRKAAAGTAKPILGNLQAPTTRPKTLLGY